MTKKNAKMQRTKRKTQPRRISYVTIPSLSKQTTFDVFRRTCRQPLPVQFHGSIKELSY